MNEQTITLIITFFIAQLPLLFMTIKNSKRIDQLMDESDKNFCKIHAIKDAIHENGHFTELEKKRLESLFQEFKESL